MADRPRTATGPKPLSEVAWLRLQVEHLQAELVRLKRDGYSPVSESATLPPPSDVPMSAKVLEAISARADAQSPTARQLATEARRLLAEGEDEGTVIQAILQGESPVI